MNAAVPAAAAAAAAAAAGRGHEEWLGARGASCAVPPSGGRQRPQAVSPCSRHAAARWAEPPSPCPLRLLERSGTGKQAPRQACRRPRTRAPRRRLPHGAQPAGAAAGRQPPRHRVLPAAELVVRLVQRAQPPGVHALLAVARRDVGVQPGLLRAYSGLGREGGAGRESTGGEVLAWWRALGLGAARHLHNPHYRPMPAADCALRPRSTPKHGGAAPPAKGGRAQAPPRTPTAPRSPARPPAQPARPP